MLHHFYRAEPIRITWRLRLGLFAQAAVVLWLTSGAWTVAVARSLVCDGSRAVSDALLVESFDSDYLRFEHATQFRRAGLDGRVLALTRADPRTQEHIDVAFGTARMTARISRISPIRVVLIRELKPLALDGARDGQRFIEREHLRSVSVHPYFEAAGPSSSAAPRSAAPASRYGARPYKGCEDGTIGP